MVLKRIGVVSAGRISGLINAAFGLLFGGFMTLVSMLGALAGAAQGGGDAGAGLAAALFGIGAVIFLPFFYGVLGFVFGMLGALAYNLIARLGGGLELEFEGDLGIQRVFE